AQHRIGDADLVRVSTGLGAVIVRALISTRQQLGSIFVPMHWNDQFAARARIDTLAPALTDPISGQPASKAIPARMQRFVASAYRFAVVRRRPEQIDAEYWAMAKCAGGWRIELAFAHAQRDWAAFTSELAGADPALQAVAYRDDRSGRHRFAIFDGDRLFA